MINVDFEKKIGQGLREKGKVDFFRK